MTKENNIINQITYCKNELLLLDRNENISDFDREQKKQEIEGKITYWENEKIKLIEVNEEKQL
jgi:hypothetical protein